MKQVLYIAPFPPRYSGQSIASEHLAKRLELNGFSLEKFDTGLRSTVGLQQRYFRALRLFKASFGCITSEASIAYITVNANRGMWFSVLFATLNRMRKRQIFLHHHTNAHLSRRTKAASYLFRLAGADAIHIVVCDIMAEQIRYQYGPNIKCCSLSNIGVVEPSPGLLSARKRASPFVLGHLSNLTEEKGCLRAIETFQIAKEAGLASSLFLAGPVVQSALRAKIESAIQKSGGTIRYLGPVYGNEKTAFFEEIDVFLFPTLYLNETQGIVNLEALSAGVPVVGYAACCMNRDLDDESCCLVPMGGDFTAPTLKFLQEMAQKPDLMVRAARRRFEALVSDGEVEFEEFCDLLKS